MKTFRNNDPSTFDMLSFRENQILELLTQHGEVGKVAELLGLSNKTVSHFLMRVKECMGFDNTMLAVLSYDRWRRSGNEWKPSPTKQQ